jgi:hypothetical protein
MSGRKTDTVVTRRIADGDINPAEANTMLVALEITKTQLDRSIKALRGYLGDRLDPNETVTGMLGSSTRRRGGEPRPRVTDIAMYGSWLFDNGEEQMTDSGYVLPIEEALDPKVITAIMKKHNIMDIPGITVQAAKADSVVVDKPTWDDVMNDPTMIRKMREVLGQTDMAEMEPATEPSDGERDSDSEEDFSWES